MAEMVIDVSDLSSEGAERVNSLKEFLKTRLDVDLRVEKDKITLKEGASSKNYLRVLIRKYLHQMDLKERYRLISGERNTVIIKRKKKRREE